MYFLHTVLHTLFMVIWGEFVKQSTPLLLVDHFFFSQPLFDEAVFYKEKLNIDHSGVKGLTFLTLHMKLPISSTLLLL